MIIDTSKYSYDQKRVLEFVVEQDLINKKLDEQAKKNLLLGTYKVGKFLPYPSWERTFAIVRHSYIYERKPTIEDYQKELIRADEWKKEADKIWEANKKIAAQNRELLLLITTSLENIGLPKSSYGIPPGSKGSTRKNYDRPWFVDIHALIPTQVTNPQEQYTILVRTLKEEMQKLQEEERQLQQKQQNEEQKKQDLRDLVRLATKYGGDPTDARKLATQIWTWGLTPSCSSEDNAGWQKDHQTILDVCARSGIAIEPDSDED